MSYFCNPSRSSDKGTLLRKQANTHTFPKGKKEKWFELQNGLQAHSNDYISKPKECWTQTRFEALKHNISPQEGRVLNFSSDRCSVSLMPYWFCTSCCVQLVYTEHSSFYNTSQLKPFNENLDGLHIKHVLKPHFKRHIETDLHPIFH